MDGSKAMTTGITYQVPATGKEVRYLLELLKLQYVDRDGLMALSRSEGSRFAESLAKAANNPNEAVLQLDYLKGVVTAASVATREAIIAAALPLPNTTDLIAMAKEEGAAFRNALRILEKGKQEPDYGAAVNFLNELIDQYGGGLSVPVLEPITPISNEPAITSPTRRPQTEQTATTGNRQDGQRVAPAAAPTATGANVRPIRNEKSVDPEQGKAAKEYWRSYKVYGAKCAMCFAEGTTRESALATVNIEMATAGHGDAGIDWANKVIFQLSVPEMPLVLAVLMGSIESIELKGHGRNNEKALSIQIQGNQFFFKLVTKGMPPRAVPVPAKEAYLPMTMLIDQMIKNNPNLNADVIMQMATRVATMHITPRAMGQGASNG